MRLALASSLVALSMVVAVGCGGGAEDDSDAPNDAAGGAGGGSAGTGGASAGKAGAGAAGASGKSPTGGTSGAAGSAMAGKAGSGGDAGMSGAGGTTAGAGGTTAGAGGATAGSGGSAAGAGGSTGGAGGTTAGAGGSTAGAGGTTAGAAGVSGGAGAGGGKSKIEHVVLIVQENHSFDTYFGRYCTAAAGSNPSCSTGPACCERAPDTEASGASPVVLDDAENGGADRDHSHTCELAEINGGKMDRFVTGASCSAAKNFSIATNQLMKTYHGWATDYALADRYFQPYAGASAANDMYFAIATWQFDDNKVTPDAIGKVCGDLGLPTVKYQGRTTIADLLLGAGHTFASYIGGYRAMVDSGLFCPAAPKDCPWGLPTPPCSYQPDDLPFQYYGQFTDNPKYMKDYGDLAKDLASGNLPTFSYVKAAQYKNEHPGYKTKISQGVAFVEEVVAAVEGSSAASSTLVLLTWDEGGGFYDHVSPPPDSPIDKQAYGTRVPMLALGPFAKKNFVSHVPMEHSSVVKFLEFNFLGGQTGQLKNRDTVVNNLGSLLDPAAVGVAVPD